MCSLDHDGVRPKLIVWGGEYLDGNTELLPANADGQAIRNKRLITVEQTAGSINAPI
jgi:hypothetical protein